MADHMPCPIGSTSDQNPLLLLKAEDRQRWPTGEPSQHFNLTSSQIGSGAYISPQHRLPGFARDVIQSREAAG
jgi:hypothetical protein